MKTREEKLISARASSSKYYASAKGRAARAARMASPKYLAYRASPEYREAHAAYRATYSASPKGRAAASALNSKYQTSPEYRASRADYHASPAGKEARRRTHLKKKYGITELDYERMIARQNGVCAICGKPGGDGSKRLHVDHCHATKKVRALLCSPCNVGIGNFKENILLLYKAAEYVENFLRGTK